ncbi:MAG: CoA transferase, partial [Betaproteobacteria bacterium]|nr:CoA transferase [Betaproteobacteria bacterium]
VPSFHLRDLEHDPHLREQRFFQPLDQPGIGPLSVLGPPWRFRRHALRPVAPSPLIAQHNDYVLRDLLGIAPAEIDRLVAEGVVEPPTPRPGGETLFQIRPAVVAPAVTAPTAAPRSARPRANPPPHSGPLAGVTVVEVASSSAAGYCGRILRDLGARVSKVMPPAPVAELAPGDELSVAYENAGKLSVTLDVASAQGEELLRRLVARADMVITDEQPAPAGTGAPPGTARSLGECPPGQRPRDQRRGGVPPRRASGHPHVEGGRAS